MFGVVRRRLDVVSLIGSTGHLAVVSMGALSRFLASVRAS
jgi:hypothetical protein